MGKGVLDSERVGCWRLLQLVVDLLDEDSVVVVVPINKLILLLDGEAALAEGDDAESCILVATVGGDESLKQTTSLGEECLGGLFRSGVVANAVDDVDVLKVATLGEDVHARHSSQLGVVDDGDGHHGLAGLVRNHADEVKSTRGVVETDSHGIEDETGLGGELDGRD